MRHPPPTADVFAPSFSGGSRGNWGGGGQDSRSFGAGDVCNFGFQLVTTPAHYLISSVLYYMNLNEARAVLNKSVNHVHILAVPS